MQLHVGWGKRLCIGDDRLRSDRDVICFARREPSPLWGRRDLALYALTCRAVMASLPMPWLEGAAVTSYVTARSRSAGIVESYCMSPHVSGPHVSEFTGRYGEDRHEEDAEESPTRRADSPTAPIADFRTRPQD